MITPEWIWSSKCCCLKSLLIFESWLALRSLPYAEVQTCSGWTCLFPRVVSLKAYDLTYLRHESSNSSHCWDCYYTRPLARVSTSTTMVGLLTLALQRCSQTVSHPDPWSSLTWRFVKASPRDQCHFCCSLCSCSTFSSADSLESKLAST